MSFLEIVEVDTKRMDVSSAARMFCDMLQAGVPDIHGPNVTAGLRVFHWWGTVTLAPDAVELDFGRLHSAKCEAPQA